MLPRKLDDFTGEWRMSGSQFNYRLCPACHSQNFKVYVSSETGAWKCFRCDTSGRVDLGVNPENVRRRLLTSMKPGPKAWPLASVPKFQHLSGEARAFIAERYGIDEPEKFNLVEGLGDFAGRIIITYEDKAGDIIYYAGRSYVGEEPKYKNMPGQHPLYVPRWAYQGPLVLVEGQFDAMKVTETYFCAAAIGGKSLPRYLLHDILAMRPESVVVMLDSDATAAALKLSRQLEPFVTVRRAMVPAGMDPASMSTDQIHESLTEALS